MKKLILIGLMFFFIQSFSQETGKKELRKQKENTEFISTEALIDSMKFKFNASHALPQDGPSIDLTTNPNYLIIKGDSIYCSMPFFGRAYNVNYNDRGGFHFAGIVENFKKNENSKKMKIELKFKMKSPMDSYQFLMTITGSKNTSLTIISNKRASISYWGEIDILNK